MDKKKEGGGLIKDEDPRRAGLAKVIVCQDKYIGFTMSQDNITTDLIKAKSRFDIISETLTVLCPYCWRDCYVEQDGSVSCPNGHKFCIFEPFLELIV